MFHLNRFVERAWPSLHQSTFGALSIVLILLFALSALQPQDVFATNNTYYVAPNGDNGNPGTFDNPFRTVQKCADTMVAGDTCFIRAGTYRETITLPRSGSAGNPITFRAYNGEVATISGAEEVTGWTQHSGSIYKTTLSYATKEVYINGSMITFARWPNATSTNPLDSPSFANMESGTSSLDTRTGHTIKNSGLTQATDYWKDAKIWFLGRERWFGRTGTVTGSSNGQISVDVDVPDSRWPETWWGVLPRQHGPFFLYNTLKALDSANEWYQDSNNVLYVWTPGGSTPSGVQAKKHTYAFDLTDRDYIEIRDLKVFSGSLLLNGSEYCVLDHITVEYVTPFYDIPNPRDREKAEYVLHPGQGAGIYITGQYNVIRNSTVAYSWGDGITLGGSNNTAINNQVHDVNYNGSVAAGISPIGEDLVVTYNTIYNTGRSGIRHRVLDGQITHNDIHDIGLINWDLGGLYSNQEKGASSAGTTIAYNLIHDVGTDASQGPNSSYNYGAGGIYLDNSTSDLLVHHNVIWNTSGKAIILNWENKNNQIYNNTLVGQGMGRWANGYSMTNVKVYNNLSTENAWQGTDLQNNLQMSSSSFVDSGAHNYRLQSNAPAVNYGQIITGITDGYIGDKPDAGAYEYGNDNWRAGYATAPTTNLVLWVMGEKGVTKNTSNSVSGWADQSGAGQQVTQSVSASQPTWQARALSGQPALQFDGGNDYLTVANSSAINSSGPYTAKTVAIVFKTGNNITNRQVLWEQGGSMRGLNLYLYDSKIYVNVWNVAETSWGPTYASAPVTANTGYYVELIYDRAGNVVTGYLNGTSMGSISGVNDLNTHADPNAIGRSSDGTRFHDNSTGWNNSYFSGQIAEILLYNTALGTNDRQVLEAYLDNKYFP